MSEAIKHYTNEFRSRRDVSPYDAEVLFEAMISETDELPLTDLLTAWAAKGTTEDELYRFASIMRSRMKKLDTKGLECVDIVGTGGSAGKTFNVSTAAAFVVAGAGVPVAKHGNRAATSSSGSADVLTCLGIDVDIGPGLAESNLAEHGICFMFAPRFHSLSATLAAARKRISVPTIFNSLGPLCNPAGSQHQLIGVWDPALVKKTARVLQLLGTGRSWVVHGDGGLDEIALNRETRVAEIANGTVHEFALLPGEFGIAVPDGEATRIANQNESAALIESILQNEATDSPDEVLIILNASAAILLSGVAKDLPAAAGLARESIRTGSAFNKLQRLRSGKK